MPLLREVTLDDIVEVTGGALIDGPEMVGISGEETVLSVSTDSRTLEPGALFVALKAERDGHDYAAIAGGKGASALLVERAVPGVPLPQIVVLDTTHALGDVARFVRDAFAGPVVGLTGSVGKTTTKEMIATVLEADFSVLKSAANHNNEIGVPQTIFDLTPAHTALVLEMGMRGPGQISRLAEIGAPTIGVVTGVGLSHIELLHSRENIARAKGELFALLPPDGLAIYPAADDFAMALRERFAGKAFSCALDTPADIRATDLVRHENGWRFAAETPWGRTKIFLPSPGRFNVLNALFAVAVGGHLGLPLDTIARSLARWTPPPMRMETIATPAGITVLSDAYNAAPDSMAGALETLSETPVGQGGKRIAVLGEMRELGEWAGEAHSTIGRLVAKLSPDMLVLVGPMAGRIGAAARVGGFDAGRIHAFETAAEAAPLVRAVVQSGDVVLVKGSRAMQMEQVVHRLTEATP